MIEYKNLKIKGAKGRFNFECYKNTEPIEIGDYFLFFFDGTAYVDKGDTETEKEEINPNDRPKSNADIDICSDFWKRCYKIKSTNFDYDKLRK